MISESGMSFPGATSDVKSHLWKSICAPPPVPVSMEQAMCFNGNQLHKLNSTHGTRMKQSLGIGKR
jgi:hypothetical protein